jgi:hypothetical protein
VKVVKLCQRHGEVLVGGFGSVVDQCEFESSTLDVGLGEAAYAFPSQLNFGRWIS